MARTGGLPINESPTNIDVLGAPAHMVPTLAQHRMRTPLAPGDVVAVFSDAEAQRCILRGWVELHHPGSAARMFTVV